MLENAFPWRCLWGEYGAGKVFLTALFRGGADDVDMADGPPPNPQADAGADMEECVFDETFKRRLQMSPIVKPKCIGKVIEMEYYSNIFH